MINNLFHMNYITSDLVVLGLAGQAMDLDEID